MPTPPSPLRDADYEAIEAAVMETDRGRWFLAEYARRHRASDTTTVLASIKRLEKIIKRDQAVPDVNRIQLDLADMAEAIARTKREIAQIQVEREDGGGIAEASAELDAIVDQTEQATQDILAAAEHMQEIAWTLREQGFEPEVCDAIEKYATDIYTACGFQDLTGQRIEKVVHVLRYLESRIAAMMDIWGVEDVEVDTVGREDARPDAHLLNGPSRPGAGNDQSEIDNLMGGFDQVEIVEPDAIADDSLEDITPPAEEVSEAPAPAELDAYELVEGPFVDEIDFSEADVFAPKPTVAEDEELFADGEAVTEAAAPKPVAAKANADKKDDGGDPTGRLTEGEKLALFS